MNIALLASDSKKKLMQSFCIAYSAILSRHALYSTDTTGTLIERVTELHVHKLLSGGLGGEKQMCAQIANDEIDMVIFLRDPDSPDSLRKHAQIMAECDEHMVPLATNLASAEMLIQGLERGELEWRIVFKD